MNSGDILTGKEVCAIFKIHASTLYRLVRQDKIPHFMVGAATRFHREEISAWSRQLQFNWSAQELRPPMT